MAGRRSFSCALIWLISLACMAAAPASGQGLDSGSGGAAADKGLRQAFEQVRYSLESSGQGTWRGENPAARLTLEFTSREVHLSHPDGSVSLHFTGYGY